MISTDTLRSLQKLTASERTDVDRIVRRHVRACMQEGMEPESLDRLFAEAIQLVKLGDSKEFLKSLPVVAIEPLRRYEQYASPREL